MIQLSIKKTARAFNEKEYHIFDKDTASFIDLKTAREWLKSEYAKSKRSKMFVDTKNGKPRFIGYVIGFRNSWDKCYE